MRRRRRRQRVFAVCLGIAVLLVVAAFGTLAFAARGGDDQIADGVTIAGIDVSGMTEEEALAALDKEVGEPARRPVTVSVRGKERELTAADVDVAVDLQGAVDKAFAASRDGNFVERGWRELTGGKVNHDVGAAVSVNKRAIRRFVNKIQSDVAVTPVDAQLSLDSATDVAVSPGKNGKTLSGKAALERRINRAFTGRAAPRELKAKIASVPPKTTEQDIWAATPVVVTIARASHTVRVFNKGKLTKSYNVAVGQPKYPTPTGKYVIQYKQKNPPWTPPNSDWAGDLAGKTIPGGAPNNPLKAAFIAFNGAVGFHGTSDIGSLGSSASHGCVRMAPADVLDLYDRISDGQGDDDRPASTVIVV